MRVDGSERVQKGFREGSSRLQGGSRKVFQGSERVRGGFIKGSKRVHQVCREDVSLICRRPPESTPAKSQLRHFQARPSLDGRFFEKYQLVSLAKLNDLGNWSIRN